MKCIIEKMVKNSNRYLYNKKDEEEINCIEIDKLLVKTKKKEGILESNP